MLKKQDVNYVLISEVQQFKVNIYSDDIIIIFSISIFRMVSSKKLKSIKTLFGKTVRL